MKTQYVEVAGIGRCRLVQNLGSHFIVEDASGTRQRMPAQSCVGYITDEAGQVVGAVIPPPPEVSDQFTGEDLGASMAAAEGGQVQCLLCDHLRTVVEEDHGQASAGHPSEEVGICRIFDQYRALRCLRTCSDFTPLPVDPLRVDGYRVGDAHQGGEG